MIRNKLLCLGIVISLSGILSGQGSNWSHFRGSNLNGMAASGNLPVNWNDSLNILWKTEVSGKGWSSPVVWGDQIWITSATPEGTEMYALCYSLRSGREIFKIKLFQQDKIYGKHDLNTYATPTPCIEQGFVYVHFGTTGTACLNTSDGSVVWKRSDLNCEHVQGPASSPVIYKNMLILHLEGTDVQYIAALDKTTGKTIWKTDRPRELYDKLQPIGKKAYITPIVISVNGKDLLISNGSAVCIAYDVKTGKEVWRIVQGEDSTIAMPFFENGLVYFYTSFVTERDGKQYCELFAVDPSGSGDVTSSHIVWRLREPILQLLTPLIKDGLIYSINTKNQLRCLEAKTGKIVYTQKMTGRYNSSPVYSNGLIYFTSLSGETSVIREGRKYELVAKNKLKGEIQATPAISGDRLIIRTSSDIYCIGD